MTDRQADTQTNVYIEENIITVTDSMVTNGGVFVLK